MPSHSHTSSSSSGRQSQRSSKHASSSSTSNSEKLKDRDPLKRSSLNTQSRSKTKSSSVSISASTIPREDDDTSALPPLSPKTSDVAAGATNRVQRPGLKSRALSAPSVPGTISHQRALERGEGGRDYCQVSVGDGLTDEEIADDPFFQRYSLPRNSDDEEGERTDRIDSVLSPASTTSASHLQPDTNLEQVSPASPRSPRYVSSLFMRAMGCACTCA